MPDSAPSDAELLAGWLSHRDEPSFHALVSRYAGLVHMAARRTCGDESLANEASQLTFILLARKGGSLANRNSLAGWLHLTAARQAKDLLRGAKRENRKLERLAMETPTHSTDDAWREIQPVLDDALAALSTKDREALLLRFYRALSVREVAETLGIATDAAQKRIDRATSRLREKLARRGCQTGGTLSAALLAGFAMDAQAAVPAVSALATKAIAAGAAGAGFFPTITALMTTTAMKTTSAVVPLAALLAVGTWLVSQRQSIARLEQQNAGFQSRLAENKMVPTTVKRAMPILSALDQRPINWAEVAEQLRKSDGAGEGFLQTGLGLKTRLKDGFDDMSIAQLESSLDEVAVAGLSYEDRNILEGILGSLLLEKAPERLTKFIDRVHDDGSSSFGWILAPAFGEWAHVDPAKAEAWFDQQIAAGKFDSLLVNGSLHTRFLFEHRLTFALLQQSAESAGRRLAAFPEEQRIKVLRGEGVGRMIYNDEALHRPFAEVLRQQLPAEDRLNAISWPLIDQGETGTIGYSAVDAYFSRIEATPEEVNACILAVTEEGRFPRESDNFFDTMPADLVALREWVTKKSPELVDEATALALKNIVNHTGNKLPQWADYAIGLHKAGAGDEVLIPIIEAHNAAEHKELILNLVRQLSDGESRSLYLKQFK